MFRYSKRLTFLHCVISRNQAANQLDHPGVTARNEGEAAGARGALMAQTSKGVQHIGRAPRRRAERYVSPDQDQREPRHDYQDHTADLAPISFFGAATAPTLIRPTAPPLGCSDVQ